MVRQVFKGIRERVFRVTQVSRARLGYKALLVSMDRREFRETQVFKETQEQVFRATQVSRA
jgi:hypothetical protein